MPEPLKDEGGSDPRTPGGDDLAPSLRTQDRQFLGEPSQRLHQGIEPALGQQLIEAAESEQDALLDLTLYPLVVNDEQVGAGTVGLRADEQVIAPVSLS